MPEAARTHRASVHLKKLDALSRPLPSYVHPTEESGEALSPTSRRIDAVIRRLGLPQVSGPTNETPRARSRPVRDQTGDFSPPISSPIDCHTTFDAPTFPIDVPDTIRPPPRPPRAASRARTPTTLVERHIEQLSAPPLQTQSLPSTPALQPAFVIEESKEAWQRDRRLSSLISGLGLASPGDALEREPEEDLSDHFEDAREGLTPSESTEHSDIEEEPAVRPQTYAEAAAALFDYAARARPRSVSMPEKVALKRQSVTRRDRTAAAAPDTESSTTADVLESYTGDFDEPDEHATAEEDYPSRKARRASNAAVRSWLPTLQTMLQPPDPEEVDRSPSPTAASSRRQSSLFEASLQTFESRTSCDSTEQAKIDKSTRDQSRKSGRRRRSSTLFVDTSAVKHTETFLSHADIPLHQSRRRSRSDAAIRPPRSSSKARLKPAIKSAACSPLLESMPLPAPSWRSTLQSGEYDLLASVYGIDELKRQEIIAELCATELAFVNGLKGVVRLFLLPLRQHDGGWIKGVPPAVGRLFDWLEDIVWLHSEISQALTARQMASHPMVNRIADVFLDFVQRLEVHQPYLVRFDAISALIEQHVKSETSAFGEFVRMQQLQPECGKMTLQSFLLKPVQRLMKYPLFFKQLCDLTPPAHPDHLASLSLHHSTDAMIRVMQEVKAREEEYASLKMLAARIRNLPRGFGLARRERRLIAHGQLQQVHGPNARGVPSSMPTSPSLTRKSSNLAARLLTSTPPSQPADKRHSILSEQSMVTDISVVSSALSSVLHHATSPKSRFFSKAEPLQVFVFRNVVLFATQHPARTRGIKAQQSHYQLVEGFGLGRVLNVVDLSSKDDEHLIELSILPIEGGDESMESLTRACSSPVTVHFSLPRAHASTRRESRTADRQRWVSAFEESLKTTLRALAMPASPSALNRKSVESIIAAGLPMPKSPSDQGLERAQQGTRQGEREERGYWHGRLKSVRREIAIDQGVLPGAPPLPPLPISTVGKRL